MYFLLTIALSYIGIRILLRWIEGDLTAYHVREIERKTYEATKYDRRRRLYYLTGTETMVRHMTIYKSGRVRYRISKYKHQLN